jgi:hypothetical protein
MKDMYACVNRQCGSNLQHKELNILDFADFLLVQPPLQFTLCDDRQHSVNRRCTCSLYLMIILIAYYFCTKWKKIHHLLKKSLF